LVVFEFLFISISVVVLDLFNDLLSFSTFFSSLIFGRGFSFWINTSPCFTSSPCKDPPSLFSNGASSFWSGVSAFLFDTSSFCFRSPSFFFSSSFSFLGTSLFDSFLGILGTSFCCWNKNAAGIFNLPGTFFGWFCSEYVVLL
jgi:hypothetical protein